jgi:hypothetical protein
VIPDMRFKNEAEFIKRRGGYTLRVDRLRQNGTLYIAGDRDSTHPSETDLIDWNFDYTINAFSGNMESLYEQIDDLAFLTATTRATMDRLTGEEGFLLEKINEDTIKTIEDFQKPENQVKTDINMESSDE